MVSALQENQRAFIGLTQQVKTLDNCLALKTGLGLLELWEGLTQKEPLNDIANLSALEQVSTDVLTSPGKLLKPFMHN